MSAAVAAAVSASTLSGAAYAFFKSSTPAAGAVVSARPDAVRLELSEPVELRFSIFKVYRLDVPAGADVRALTTAATAAVWQRLLARGDEAARSDLGVATKTREAAGIGILLKPDLPAGAYLVMWRVRSADTHTTEGSYVFVYRPAR